ncbi:uncharacterized protein LOC114580158 isoform X2 [Dendrobium catenatum]|uniref:uncharacterized protein LOC114580158 isoform X2 n=1 Tax=Dendrobium catenatum TaxID=906689 RepID=UPI0010A0A9A8|nr:uncharacterized protein LOC114580158 isoform X2 [Dendrobium catenatum]
MQTGAVAPTEWVAFPIIFIANRCAANGKLPYFCAVGVRLFRGYLEGGESSIMMLNAHPVPVLSIRSYKDMLSDIQHKSHKHQNSLNSILMEVSSIEHRI